MKNLQVLKNAALAGLVVVSLGANIGAAAAAEAQRTVVTRGPNGAASIVDRVPLGATPLPTSAAHDFPQLIQRGPGGAATILNDKSQDTNRVQPPAKTSALFKQAWTISAINPSREAFLNNPDKG